MPTLTITAHPNELNLKFLKQLESKGINCDASGLMQFPVKVRSLPVSDEGEPVDSLYSLKAGQRVGLTLTSRQRKHLNPKRVSLKLPKVFVHTCNFVSAETLKQGLERRKQFTDPKEFEGMTTSREIIHGMRIPSDRLTIVLREIRQTENFGMLGPHSLNYFTPQEAKYLREELEKRFPKPPKRQTNKIDRIR
ncbi:MAG: hypothetical protein V1875_04235 [Candidatus Altiarchaeota archaeon]